MLKRIRNKIILLFYLIVFFAMIIFSEDSHSKKRDHYNLKLRITDFWRSPLDQANLIQRFKNNKYNLYKLYLNTKLVKEIESAKNVEDVEVIIRKYINQGVYLSKHLCGKALDVSKDEGVTEFISFLSQIDGIKILDEGDHYHIEITTKCKI